MMDKRTYTCPLCGRDVEFFKYHLDELCPNRDRIKQNPDYPAAS